MFGSHTTISQTMNVHAMRSVAQLVGWGSMRRAMLPVVQQPLQQQQEFARPFRTTTVQMGRRAAKIAGRKVGLWWGLSPQQQ